MTKAKTNDCELLWPYPLLWVADHWGKDYLQFMARMTRARTPTDVVGAETALADHYLRDLIIAWSDLCLIPMRVFTAAGLVDADQTAER